MSGFNRWISKSVLGIGTALALSGCNLTEGEVLKNDLGQITDENIENLGESIVPYLEDEYCVVAYKNDKCGDKKNTNRPVINFFDNVLEDFVLLVDEVKRENATEKGIQLNSIEGKRIAILTPQKVSEACYGVSRKGCALKDLMVISNALRTEKFLNIWSHESGHVTGGSGEEFESMFSEVSTVINAYKTNRKVGSVMMDNMFSTVVDIKDDNGKERKDSISFMYKEASFYVPYIIWKFNGDLEKANYDVSKNSSAFESHTLLDDFLKQIKEKYNPKSDGELYFFLWEMVLEMPEFKEQLSSTKYNLTKNEAEELVAYLKILNLEKNGTEKEDYNNLLKERLEYFAFRNDFENVYFKNKVANKISPLIMNDIKEMIADGKDRFSILEEVIKLIDLNKNLPCNKLNKYECPNEVRNNKNVTDDWADTLLEAYHITVYQAINLWNITGEPTYMPLASDLAVKFVENFYNVDFETADLDLISELSKENNTTNHLALILMAPALYESGYGDKERGERMYQLLQKLECQNDGSEAYSIKCQDAKSGFTCPAYNLKNCN